MIFCFNCVKWHENEVNRDDKKECYIIFLLEYQYVDWILSWIAGTNWIRFCSIGYYLFGRQVGQNKKVLNHDVGQCVNISVALIEDNTK